MTLVIGDFLLVPLSYVGGFYIRFGNLVGFEEKIPLFFLPLMAIIYAGIFYLFDLYEPKKKFLNFGIFSEVFLGVLISGIIISFLKYGFFLFPIGRGIFVLSNLLITISTLLWRAVCQQMFKFLVRPKRILVIGPQDIGRDMHSLFESAANEIELAGILDDTHYEALSSLIERQKIDQIIVTSAAEKNPLLSKALLNARMKGIEISNLIEIYRSLGGRIPVKYVSESWFLDSKVFGLSGKSLSIKVKRIADIFISAVLLALSLPLWPFIALAIKINSRGPVTYKQKRVGQNEGIFFLYKFRSMVDKAEKNGAVWAEANDKRVTFVGKILRKIHLDELPQLLNVLSGDMSLVGPRPERPEFVQELKANISYYSFRHIMKPGLTGWAQVNFPYASSLVESQEKLEYDLYYISRVSLLLDIKILMRTLKSVLLGKRPRKA